ncbi:GNAT family N-acetyltransferase [Paenibacillus thalictri]|uniref:GNAT family N-acetyltransferase n=1 Tax=Paenibacillus thalictri TaxID=2527873 RepID=A0A4Q9DVV4_9BACL|nr:GNAT family N-acetyltransferase [Paenibacillus thalictri]TBL80424.1 GNAT family N-acetyltransferase [Paenibacillus thalictri]
MSARDIIPLSGSELMELHAAALFTHDPNMRLRAINEPWPGAAQAPRFFLGRTMEGPTVRRYRHDLSDELIERLETLCAEESELCDVQAKPQHFKAYMDLLHADRFTMGPCYRVADQAPHAVRTVSLRGDDIADVLSGGFEWLASEIDYAQPCIALVLDNRAVSVCRSVRITAQAHEAGLETLEPFRGKGYAAAVVAGWAAEVRKMGAVPLYSTSWENTASQRVAEKSNLIFYGVNFTVI